MVKKFSQPILIILVAIILVLLPLLVTSPYYLDLLIIMVINSVLAMSFLMMLKTGLISLGISAFWGIGAYVSTILVTKFNLSYWFSLPATTLITAIFALCLGFVLIGSGSGGFSFVILSSVIAMLFTVVVGNIGYLGGYYGIANIPPPNPINIPFLPTLDFTSKASSYYLALFILLVVILITSAFYRSSIGRAWTVIGLSTQLAKSMSINILRYKLACFVIASAIVGLIGAFYAHYSAYVVPENFSLWQNIYIQIYAILGGIGFPILGPMLGSAIMVFLPELMRGFNVVAPVITGAILILLILFLPQGLLGLGDNLPIVKKRIAWLSKAMKSLTTKSGMKNKQNEIR